MSSGRRSAWTSLSSCHPQLPGCVPAPPTPALELECQKDDLVDPPLVLCQGDTVDALADLSRCCFKLIPKIAAPLDKQGVLRIDDHQRASVFEDQLAPYGGIQAADLDRAKAPTTRSSFPVSRGRLY